MSEEKQRLFQERLKRYQGAIALAPIDRVPIAPGSNYFAEVYSGLTHYEFVYDNSKWMEADKKFVEDFPEVDALRSGRIWGPLHDIVGFNLYKLPGRDLPVNVQFQFIEGERMKPDEYDLLINDPVEFMFERFLPRAFNEMKNRGSARSYAAFLKAGMAQMALGAAMRNRALYLQEELGMPQPMTGVMLAPFDMLADGLRGLRGIMIDIRRRPDKVLEACEALIPELVNAALAIADPLRRYPIFMPLHRGCYPFLSPKQFDEFYWPSLKKAMLMLIDAGYTIRAYLEGDWGPNWHHIRELPKGKVLCDIDNQGDIFKAKADFGDCQCIAGGVPDSLLILGTPDEVRERVKLLCETVGKDGGFIVNGGCGIPYNTKPENFRALIDATLEYGRYRDKTEFEVQCNPNPPAGWQPPKQRMITPWEVKKAELGEIKGDEDLIRMHWEMFERMAYNWLWNWTW
ncbi:MAG: uroporphyrinogen decarboxylase [Syntrophothermus sp.]|uniref:uroporphyrinogen decarboxylase family protein n=1 Tax=Syntrophothermus sp. TaxID=2736299 RepID=UPI00257CEE28|nr:uroporphyrinogen decarboxylase family protein [Syntrophothermus sp.]NSW84285.1 uroporphyrinogen decarboxylase [Syntrophothermus sp.]